MYHTFNMGIGMVMAVSTQDCDTILNAPELAAFNPVQIGSVVEGSGKVLLGN